MQVEEACRILGVTEQDDDATIRTAYRRLLLRHHPDVSTSADSTAVTARLAHAYRELTDSGRSARATTSTATDPEGAAVGARLLDANTIAVDAPADEVFLLLIDVAHDLGEISYLDHSAGLMEVIVEFEAAPTSSVLLTLQGRATGVTEVFCTVDPLSGGDAPPDEAVARLVLRTLVGDSPTEPAPPP